MLRKDDTQVSRDGKNIQDRWKDVILDPVTGDKKEEFDAGLKEKLARYLHEDIHRTRDLYTSPFPFSRDFYKLSAEEKSFWETLVGEIPDNLIACKLRIRRYGDFCRTCLIPYTDLENMARNIYNNMRHKKRYGLNVCFDELPEKRKRFFIELCHLIPVELKKTGFEIIRPEEIAEINEKLVQRLARAIHSRYLHQLRKQHAGTERNTYLNWLHRQGSASIDPDDDFDNLPEEVRQSNLDNAYHIPAKLLAIGYKIRPARKGFKSLVLHLDDQEVEAVAKVEHIRWCWDKILNGWIYGKERDNKKKTHPSIVPYEDLSEQEREKDRELVRLIPALLRDIDYEAYPVNPEKISRIPYAIKPHSSIHRILDETRDLSDHLLGKVTLPRGAEQMIAAGNRKIEEAIREVEGSYNYALQIQESYLPDSLYIRECFSDSFVLFRPKDIVSGDFYFFSRQNHRVIFAAADCTGHGIPGALLSTIGYGILDQAVNELKITEPSKILGHLYSRIHRFLKPGPLGTMIYDDLDIVLCTLDLKSGKLVYSGVGNSLYHISGSDFLEYKPGNVREGVKKEDDYSFTSETIKIRHGDNLYLCTDGYADQFGGNNHKKYQSGRLKEKLRQICGFPMPEQGDILYEEIERWREENNEDQTDDILVIGIRI